MNKIGNLELKYTTVSHIRLETDAGATEYPARREAVAVSVLLNLPVSFSFNSKEYTVHPDDALNAVKQSN